MRITEIGRVLSLASQNIEPSMYIAEIVEMMECKEGRKLAYGRPYHNVINMFKKVHKDGMEFIKSMNDNTIYFDHCHRVEAIINKIEGVVAHYTEYSSLNQDGTDKKSTVYEFYHQYGYKSQ